MSEENGRGAGEGSGSEAGNAPGVWRCYETTREIGQSDNRLASAIARQQGAEDGMKNTQAGLIRLPFVLMLVLCSREIVMPLGEIVLEVPDGVSECTLLCGQQQKDAQETQRSASCRHRSCGPE